ncbi:MAG: cobyric acid synthase [Coriobacteriia bacterium]|nr:cobyric acid synthase [Coriobacteriia bacterium]
MPRRQLSARPLMIQGTMSNVGKSILVAGLCRVFYQDGYAVAPFKSQNMALNSYITPDGLEMARAQMTQAEAACIAPSVLMNPILLKPVTDGGSEVIVNGENRGHMRAVDYFQFRKSLIPDIMKAFTTLQSQFDIVLIEGAGSPAEINLKENDIVNMGLAELTDAHVLLVGDIDPGGVFAQLVGTLVLLEDHERDRVKGLVINKFRGDFELLRPGISMLEGKAQKPVVGTLPYLPIDIEDEDSLSQRLSVTTTDGTIDIAVIRFPRISNFSDFAVLEATEGIGLRYVENTSQLGQPDLLVLPGTENILSDLGWLRQNGLADAIRHLAEQGYAVLGLAGGYQLLGLSIEDPDNDGGQQPVPGLGLLPVKSVLQKARPTTRASGRIVGGESAFGSLKGIALQASVINASRTTVAPDSAPDSASDSARPTGEAPDNARPTGEAGLIQFADGSYDGYAAGNVAGCNVQGFFDPPEIRLALIQALATAKGAQAPADALDFSAYKNEQYNILAAAIREHLDLEFIYHLLEE